MKKTIITAEEYLQIDELSEKIKYKKQSLYNKIYKGEFVLGKHYLKPSPKKILFKWTGIKEWLGDDADCQIQDNEPFDYIKNSEEKYSHDNTNSERCRIKI